MTGPGAHRDAHPDGYRMELTGWGRTAPTAADVVHAVHPDVVDRAMADAVSAGAAGGRGIVEYAINKIID